MRRSSQSAVETDEVQPIFLISAPRSGSSWLRDLLRLHPQIAAGEETYAFEAIAQLAATIERRAERGQGLLARGYLDRTALYAACAQFFRAAVHTHVDGRPYFLEKTPLNTDLLPLIHAVFPRAPVLHLIRDGRDVAYSMLAGREQRRHLPTTVAGCAERWLRIRQVLDFGRAHPALYAEVRYEAAVADPAGELRRLFQFLDLSLSESDLAAMCAAAARPVHPSGASASLGYRDKWRAAFSAEDVATFKQIAGVLLIELGYERNDDW
jgi:hypothetical protein